MRSQESPQRPYAAHPTPSHGRVKRWSRPQRHQEAGESRCGRLIRGSQVRALAGSLPSPGGGIGRRAVLRGQCPYGRAGSIPVPGTVFFIFSQCVKTDSPARCDQTQNFFSIGFSSQRADVWEIHSAYHFHLLSWGITLIIPPLFQSTTNRNLPESG